MKIIKNDLTVFVDVDDTLVDWVASNGLEDTTHTTRHWWTDPLDDVMKTIVANEANVRLLKEKSVRGWTVVVWSLGGAAHAASIVTALRLTDYVDYVIGKPQCIIDDKDPVEWLPKRIFLPPEMKYKK